MIRAIPLLGLLMLGACVAPARDALVSIPGTADAERALLKSIADVQSAAATVGRGYSAPVAATETIPSELNQRVRYTRKGSLDEVASALAGTAGFRFSSNATQATKPIPVSLDTPSSSVLDLLRSLGAQAGSQADVVVRPEDHTVEVRYRA